MPTNLHLLPGIIKNDWDERSAAQEILSVPGIEAITATQRVSEEAQFPAKYHLLHLTELLPISELTLSPV